MADNCPTCVLLRALLASAGVNAPMAEKVAFSEPVMQADGVVKRKAKKKVSKYQESLENNSRNSRRNIRKPRLEL